VATVDVSRARAQTTEVTPTACAMGTLEPCGTQPITSCETTIHFDLNLFLRTGGFKFTQTNCTVGHKTLYKDRRTPTSGSSTGGAYKTCSATPTSGTSDDGFEANIELCED
jgi:hypothetical protein